VRQALRSPEAGYAVLQGLVEVDDCRKLLSALDEGCTSEYADKKMYKALDGGSHMESRPRVVGMERYSFGFGRYTYIAEPLFEPLGSIRAALYKGLVDCANTEIAHHRRMIRPKPFTVTRYPSTLEAFHDLCKSAKPPQSLPTCLVLHYYAGGHNLPHRDIYGCVSFPYQALLMLAEAGEDYTGGEFFMQPSKELENDHDRRRVKMKQGDCLVFRSSIWHGSEVTQRGKRTAVALQFHLSK